MFDTTTAKLSYYAVAAAVGHVVICFKGADLVARGIERLSERLEVRRALKRSRLNDVDVVDAEFKVVK